ncbi:MAG: hypothetical protein CMLOHMNK_02399 [Steroidobacteraceae bacterium]|nr:hypothetical protein [Steroidobacteraceae bacterium]
MRRVFAALGPATFLVTVLVPAPQAFAGAAWPVFGLAVWMAIWWATEAIPLAATALLPLAIVPLTGLPSPAQVLTEYANPTIFLILGGFLLGLAMERWHLHARIAYSIIAAVGSEPRRLVLGVMIATAFVSLWVSNTSTTLMMLPVASSIVALLTATLWISRPWLTALPGLHGLTDTVIAIVAGLTLFLLPAGGEAAGASLLDSEALRRVPWDVLILFGGGLVLAAAIQASTLSATFGMGLRGIAHWPALALTLTVVLLLVLWTEFNSNVATAATFMPVLAAMADGHPGTILVLIAPAAMAASAGFMLPVGTPPNAIVFGTGRISMRQMLRTGLLVDLAAVVVITVVARLVL